MDHHGERTITILSAMFIGTIFVLTPTAKGSLDARCNWSTFIPRYCNVQPWETGNAMSCFSQFLDARFLAISDGEPNGRCLAKIHSLTYTCTDPLRSSDLTNLTFDAFPNLVNLQLTNCRFARLYRTNLAHTNVNTIKIINIFTGQQQHAPFIMDAWSIQQLFRLSVFRISGLNVSLVPRNEFCNIQNNLDLSDNVLTNIHSLNFGYSSDNERQFSNNGLCGQQLKTLKLMSNHFKILPDFGFNKLKNLIYLDLENNGIEVIEQKAFDNLYSLTNLYLEKNNIATVVSRMWFDLPNIVDFRLESNRIEGTLAFTTFNVQTSLKYFSLMQNKISYLHSFPPMGSLESIILADNSITSIRDNAFLNISASLSKLFLENNKLAHISSMTFSGLSKLTMLDIKNNRLESIDSTAFQCCPDLIYLNLFTNRLKIVPDFSFLYNILHLHISGNEIESLPTDCFSNLTKISFLSMGRNQLTAISKLMFARNVEMKNLHIYDNKLSEISIEIFEHNRALEELQLGNNSIRTMPRLTQLTSLINLDMQINAIDKLDFNLLPHSLIKLNMSHNNITTFSVPSNSFDEFKLNELDVSHNLLDAVPFQFRALIKLDISHNQLTSLPSEAFHQLDNLQEVDLRDNQLQTLNRAAVKISGQAGTPYFLLEGNQLRCDCTTWWIKEVNHPNLKFPGPRYGQIGDIDSVNCAVRIFGHAEVEVMPVSNVSQDRFLCDFQQDTELVKIYLDTHDQRYDIQCPVQCHCYFNHDWSLFTTYCSRRLLKAVPLHMPSNSIYIYIDGNDIKTLTIDSFDVYKFVNRIFINSSNIHSIEDNVFEKMTELRELYLEGNRIEVLGQHTFAGLHKLLQLYLQSNALQVLHPQVFMTPGSIRVLRLDNNRLTRFPPFDLMATITITSLTLSQNWWDCQCTNDTKQILNLLDQSSNSIVDKNNTKCYSSNSQVDGMPLFKFYAEMCDDVALSRNTIIYISVSVFVTLMVVTVAIMAFVYRYEMQVILYCRYNFRLFPQLEDETLQDSGKLFDAFVAYSSLDEAFVVEELIPRLEGDRHFRLCLHHRDFKVGGFITNSILEAVEFSRRTIVVMSENFVSSNWCRFEFKSAHIKMMEDRCRRLIMIVLGDVPENLDPEVQLYFKTNTYLQRSDRLFWEKLYFAMPRRGLQTNTLELTPIENSGQ